MAHKAEYETFVSQFPPVSEISFVTMITWWNVMGTAAAAWLNGNLVVVYYLAGDEEKSGLSLIGVNMVDESICEVFDYLRDKGESARLVHVSEFVINRLRYPELFKLEEERDYHEYVMAVDNLYPLNSTTNRMHPKIGKLLSKIGQENIEVKKIDLKLSENKDLLIEHASKVWHMGTLNASPQLTHETLLTMIHDSEKYGIGNICLYVHNRLQGFFLYRFTHDNEFVIANYARVNARVAGMPELLIFSCAQWFASAGIKKINFDFDLGNPLFRGYLLTVAPAEFFRKYTVEPSS